MTLLQANRVAVVVLAVIAAFIALNLAKSVFAPLFLALVVGVVLSPLARTIDKLGLPKAAGAFIGLFLILMIIVGLALLIEPYIQMAIEQFPVLVFELRTTIAGLQQAFAELNTWSEEFARAFNPERLQTDSEEATIAMPRITDALLLAPAAAAQIMIFVGTLFFFLLSRDDIYHWIARQTPLVKTVPTAWVLKRAETRVSSYFLTITVINVTFGVAVTIAFTLIGMPMALMWGVLATLLNFLLYLGPVIMASCLLIAGHIVFDNFYAFVPAITYVMLNMMEGQFITPTLIGRRMSVSPLMVFFSLIFWLWLWGPIGGIVAIPLLVWVIAVFQDVPQAEFERRLEEKTEHEKKIEAAEAILAQDDLELPRKISPV